MKLARLVAGCALAALAALASPAVSFAQAHPEFAQIGRVSAAIYKPDNGPAPHIAFWSDIAPATASTTLRAVN
jgi:hypothetical protein